MQRFQVRKSERAEGLALVPQSKFLEAYETVLFTLEVEGDGLVLLASPVVETLVITVIEAGLAKDAAAVKDMCECSGFTPVLRELLTNAGRTATMYRPGKAKTSRARPGGS